MSLHSVTPSCPRHTSPCTSFQPAPCLHPPFPLPPSSSRVPSRSLPSPSSLHLAGREELARGDPQLPQAFYSVQSSTLWPGDRLKVTCDFNSSNKRVATSSGGTHNDEMCNMWVVEGGHRAERAKARGRRGAGSGACCKARGGNAHCLLCVRAQPQHAAGHAAHVMSRRSRISPALPRHLASPTLCTQVCHAVWLAALHQHVWGRRLWRYGGPRLATRQRQLRGGSLALLRPPQPLDVAARGNVVGGGGGGWCSVGAVQVSERGRGGAPRADIEG